MGLSPPTRGSLCALLGRIRLLGSIPAHAGEPGRKLPSRMLHGVYPRPRGGAEALFATVIGSSPELCVKVRGSSSMLLLGCLGDLLRFEKREIQVATFAPDRSSP